MEEMIMTNEDKKKLWDANKVHVAHGCWSNTSTCDSDGCDCKKSQKYMIFIGGSQLSNLWSCVCDEHLPLEIDRAIKKRNETVEKNIKQQEEKEVEDAKKLLREKKLNKIV